MELNKLEEKTKVMLIEYMTVLGVVVGLVMAGIFSPDSWVWVKPLLISLLASVFGTSIITNHIPTLISSVKKNKPSIDLSSQSLKVEPPSQPDPLEAKMGGFIDLATGVLERGLKVVDSQLMREIEEEYEEEPPPLEDPEIEVSEEVIANAEEKIKDFLLKKDS